MLVNYTLENLLSQYDCLVVVEPDRAEQRMLQKHFGVDGSAGFYRIEKSGNRGVFVMLYLCYLCRFKPLRDHLRGFLIAAWAGAKITERANC